MNRRILLIFGLAILASGGAIGAHAAVAGAAPSGHHVALTRANTGAEAADPDASTPCSTNAETGEQVGNCADVQNQGGPDEASGQDTSDVSNETR